VDIAHPQFEDQIHTVIQTLNELDSSNKPTMLLLNKIDLYRSRYFDALLEDQVKTQIEEELEQNLKQQYETETLLLSATTRENLDIFREKLARMVRAQYNIRYPYRVKTY
jgi:GTP-binding protein HflX